MNTFEAIAGSTVRIVNTFFNFDGKPQDPQLVKLKIYDRKYKVIQNINLSDGNKLETGKYFYDWKTPSEIKERYIIEFYGEISGNPTIERKQLVTKFI